MIGQKRKRDLNAVYCDEPRRKKIRDNFFNKREYVNLGLKKNLLNEIQTLFVKNILSLIGYFSVIKEKINTYKKKYNVQCLTEINDSKSLEFFKDSFLELDDWKYYNESDEEKDCEENNPIAISKINAKRIDDFLKTVNEEPIDLVKLCVSSGELELNKKGKVFLKKLNKSINIAHNGISAHEDIHYVVRDYDTFSFLKDLMFESLESILYLGKMIEAHDGIKPKKIFFFVLTEIFPYDECERFFLSNAQEVDQEINDVVIGDNYKISKISLNNLKNIIEYIVENWQFFSRDANDDAKQFFLLQAVCFCKKYDWQELKEKCEQYCENKTLEQLEKMFAQMKIS